MIASRENTEKRKRDKKYRQTTDGDNVKRKTLRFHGVRSTIRKNK